MGKLGLGGFTLHCIPDASSPSKPVALTTEGVELSLPWDVGLLRQVLHIDLQLLLLGSALPLRRELPGTRYTPGYYSQSQSM